MEKNLGINLKCFEMLDEGLFCQFCVRIKWFEREKNLIKEDVVLVIDVNVLRRQWKFG